MGFGIKQMDDISDKTTHVVLFGTQRTLKVMNAIVRGLCIVEPRWLQESSKAGAVCDPEAYQVTTFAGAKRAHQGEPAPFADLMLFFEGSNWKIAVRDLKRLASRAGAKVCAGPMRASIIVSAPNGLRFQKGQYAPADDDDDDDAAAAPPTILQEDWILDS